MSVRICFHVFWFLCVFILSFDPPLTSPVSLLLLESVWPRPLPPAPCPPVTAAAHLLPLCPVLLVPQEIFKFISLTQVWTQTATTCCFSAELDLKLQEGRSEWPAFLQDLFQTLFYKEDLFCSDQWVQDGALNGPERSCERSQSESKEPNVVLVSWRDETQTGRR